MNDNYRREHTKKYLNDLRKKMTFEQISIGAGVSIASVFGWNKGRVPKRREFDRLQVFYQRSAGTPIHRDWPPPERRDPVLQAILQRLDSFDERIKRLEPKVAKKKSSSV